MLQTLIGPLTELFGGYLERRAEEKKAKHEAKLQIIQNEASWEKLMAQASNSSWKDEWFTILLSSPIVVLMWGVAVNDPLVIERIRLGFDTLNQLPDWYQYALYMAISASFGIRGADKLMALRGKK